MYYPRSAYVFDGTGDGLVDILAPSGSSSATESLLLFENQGGTPPSFVQRVVTAGTVARPRSVFSADVDGDGKVDVLSASSGDNKIAWYRNEGGTPPTWTAYNISTTALGAWSVHAADLDSNGRMDVLSASFSDNKIVWYENGGGFPPIWTARTINAAAMGARVVSVADVDGDGRLDVLSGSYNDDKVMWYENGGGYPLTWTARVVSSVANGVVCVFSAEMNGDGRMDIISASYNDNKVAWYENGGGFPPTWTLRVITTSASRVAWAHAADIGESGSSRSRRSHHCNQHAPGLSKSSAHVNNTLRSLPVRCFFFCRW
jgi:hypothetical protein